MLNERLACAFNLHSDLIASTRLQVKLKYSLIIAVTCTTFSLLSILIGSSFVPTIAIVKGDPDGGDKDNQDSVRRVA